tara:strand:- start:2592 stop:3281 length:690 start_codon:yes stop_codon:yes gene_type:complete
MRNIENYLKIYKSKGLRMVIEYFIYNHLFDIINKTNTHSMEGLQGLETKELDAVAYTPTWIKDIKKATVKLEKIIGKKEISNGTLIDLGSGKGKVLIAWKLLYPKHKKIIGLEYNQNHISISYKNFDKLNLKNIEIINGDASTVMLEGINADNYRVFFMYNPFGIKTIKKFFANNISQKVGLIYFNPVHHAQIKDLGFEEIYSNNTYRAGGSFSLYLYRSSYNKEELIN